MPVTGLIKLADRLSALRIGDSSPLDDRTRTCPRMALKYWRGRRGPGKDTVKGFALTGDTIPDPHIDRGPVTHWHLSTTWNISLPMRFKLCRYTTIRCYYRLVPFLMKKKKLKNSFCYAISSLPYRRDSWN